MSRGSKRYLVIMAGSALLVGGLVGGLTHMAGAQSETPTSSADALRQQALENAQSPSAASDSSEGVPISDCPDAVAQLKAAGVSVSPDDHISPGCSAAADLAETAANSDASAAK